MRFVSMLLAASVSALAAPARAQEVPNPAMTAALDGATEIYVNDAAAPGTLHGLLTRIGPSTLTLLADGQSREIPIDRIARIDKAGDSVWNGAFIGAAIFTAWCAALCGQGLDSNASLAPVVLFNGIVGGLVGAGIDAAHQGRTTVYRGTGRAGPIRGPGLSIQVRF